MLNPKIVSGITNFYINKALGCQQCNEPRVVCRKMSPTHVTLKAGVKPILALDGYVNVNFAL